MYNQSTIASNQNVGTGKIIATPSPIMQLHNTLLKSGILDSKRDSQKGAQNKIPGVNYSNHSGPVDWSVIDTGFNCFTQLKNPIYKDKGDIE